jgi:hypothetical protein
VERTLNNHRGDGVETEQLQVRVEEWRRALLVAAALTGGLIAVWGIADFGAVAALPLFLVGAVVPLGPLLIRGRRDFAACSIAIGLVVLVLALLMLGLGLVVYIPTGLVLVLAGAAEWDPAFGMAGAVIAVLAVGGFGALAVGALAGAPA